MEVHGWAARLWFAGNLAMAIFFVLTLLDDPAGALALEETWRGIWVCAGAVVAVCIPGALLLGTVTRRTGSGRRRGVRPPSRPTRGDADEQREAAYVHQADAQPPHPLPPRRGVLHLAIRPVHFAAVTLRNPHHPRAR